MTRFVRPSATALVALAALTAAASCDPDLGPTVFALEPGEALLTILGETRSLQPVGTDGVGVPLEPADLQWTSSDAGVATVNAAGTVTAVAPGTVTITASVTDGASAEAEVTVLDAGVLPVAFLDGTVITVDPIGRIEEAIVVVGDRIHTTGSTDRLGALVSPSATFIDLDGATLMPGFVDPHNHAYNNVFLGRSPGWVGGTYAQAEQTLIELGLTAMANANVWPAAMTDFKAHVDTTQLRLRTSVYPAYNDFCGPRNPVDWYLAYPPIHAPDQRFRIPGIKFFGDGGACGRGAFSFYSDGGDLYFTVDSLIAAIQEVEQLGYQALVHTLGDIAADSVLAALDAVIDGGTNPHRHRMDHNRYLRNEQLARYSQVGAHPVVFGYPATCWIVDGQSWSFLDNPANAALQDRFDPWRALLDANPDLIIAWKSDVPFGPHSPVENLWNLVTRDGLRDDGSLCDAPPWLEAGAITVPEALEMMTINAAYVLGLDSYVGSLADGKAADLIILSGDPLTVSVDDIRHIDVHMTMIGGRVEHCAQGQADLCP